MTTVPTMPRLPIKACPSWCTLPTGHGWDSYNPDTGVQYRGHAGPNFGEFISCSATEESTGRTTYEAHVWCDGVDLNPTELLDLAAHAVAAAAWLESVR